MRHEKDTNQITNIHILLVCDQIYNNIYLKQKYKNYLEGVMQKNDDGRAGISITIKSTIK